VIVGLDPGVKFINLVNFYAKNVNISTKKLHLKNGHVVPKREHSLMQRFAFTCTCTYSDSTDVLVGYFFFWGGGGRDSFCPSSSALHFSKYSFRIHRPVNWDDRHLLAHAMACDFSVTCSSRLAKQASLTKLNRASGLINL
jgi:hypothetical protein